MAGATIAGQQNLLAYAQAQYPYMALTTTAPTDSAAGTETTYVGYARKQLVSGDWTAGTAATPSVSSNASTINFNACTGGGAQTVTHFELWSASSGGTRGFWGALVAPLTVSSGITPNFAAGQLTMNAD